MYDLTTDESLRRRIVEELRWGNRYFLNMQEPAGGVMAVSHVGGDALQHGDDDRWTDNVVGPEGGEPNTIAPLPGGSRAKITIVGPKDDRVIQTRPLDRVGQYKFVIAEAMTARIMKPLDEPVRRQVPAGGASAATTGAPAAGRSNRSIPWAASIGRGRTL